MKLSKTDLPSLFLFVCSAFVHSYVRFVRLFVRSFVRSRYFVFLVAQSFVRLLVCLQRSKFFNFEETSTRGKTAKRMINRTLTRSHARTLGHTSTLSIRRTHARTHKRTNEWNARGSNFTKFWKNNYSFLKTIWGIKHKKQLALQSRKYWRLTMQL